MHHGRTRAPARTVGQRARLVALLSAAAFAL